MENVEVLFKDAFVTDTKLTKQLIALEYSVTKQPLGIPLVPTETICSLCGGKLLLRRDCPSRMTLYTECMGSVPGTHFHKFCSNNRKGCNFVQYYEYLKSGMSSLHYSSDWMTLPYFLSSQETGFEMKMLKNFDVELLIGQISYKQKAAIYNVANGYDTTRKICTTLEKDEKHHKDPVHGYDSLLAYIYQLQHVSMGMFSNMFLCHKSVNG